jgi:hypothetical protein
VQDALKFTGAWVRGFKNYLHRTVNHTRAKLCFNHRHFYYFLLLFFSFFGWHHAGCQWNFLNEFFSWKDFFCTMKTVICAHENFLTFFLCNFQNKTFSIVVLLMRIFAAGIITIFFVSFIIHEMIFYYFEFLVWFVYRAIS